MCGQDGCGDRKEDRSGQSRTMTGEGKAKVEY